MTDLRRMSVFRDVQVAMDFHQMAELGYIDHEFTMYGCVYWENNTRQYIMSSHEGDIWQFIDEGKWSGRCMTPVESLKKVAPVPMGQKEQMALKVKIDLAWQLQRDYPAEFMAAFANIQAAENTDTARPILEKVCKEVTCTFSEENLSLAEGLVLMAYDSKVLSESSFKKLMAVLSHERDMMLEDTVAKDILQKQFFTIMYEAAPGQYKKLTNARKEWVLQKKFKLENEGKLVSPIYSGCYWYNNQQSMDTVKERHLASCQRMLTDEYFAVVKAIAACAGPFDQHWLDTKCQALAQTYGDKAGEMLNHYRARWHIPSGG